MSNAKLVRQRQTNYLRKAIFVIFTLLMLAGVASANTYTQNGSWDLKSPLNTSNTYDSSKISSLSINLTPTIVHKDPSNIPGLVARFMFDDNLTNSVNASNNGVAAGNITYAHGKYNNASVFNVNGTTGDYVTINDPILGATEFTISFLANASTVQYGSFISDWNGTVYNFAIYINDSTSIRAFVGNGTNYSYSLTNNNWTANQTHRVTFTYSAITNRMELWVDGYKAGSTAAGNSGAIPNIGTVQTTGTGSCSFGRYLSQWQPTKGFLNGSLDDACFWNRVLTDSEITSLNYDTLGGFGVKSNANASVGVVPTNGGIVSVPYNSGDAAITSLSASIPSSVTIDGVTIYDYVRTVPPVSYNINVVSSEEYKPVSSFTHTATGTAPVTISFTDTSSNLPTSWNWNFGDGKTSHSQNPSHTYDAAGTYTVTLTASNGAGFSTSSQVIGVLPANGASGVINNAKRVAIYIANTETQPLSHDNGIGSMFHDCNITYLTNSTVPSSLSTANFDLLVVGGGSDTTGILYGGCSNSTAKYINDYVANGGCVIHLADPLNESNAYMTNMSNATWGLPANRFFWLGGLGQINVTAGSTLTINNADPMTSFMPASIISAATTSRWTNTRNFGAISGQNAYGYNYTELVYHNGDNTRCQMAKMWNDTTGARVVYLNPQLIVSGGDVSYFNATTSAKLWDNVKAWTLKLDNNTKHVSVTYPRGDRQFVCAFDDIDMAANPANMDNFFAMIDAQPNDIGITSFVIPTGKNQTTTPSVMAGGYNYLRAHNVDVDTIHPHQPDLANPPAEIDWWHNYVPLATMQNSLWYYMHNYSIGANDPDLEFLSIRFPQTKTNTTSTQAAVNLGFKIASDYGQATTMSSFRDSHTNMRYLQAQKIVSGVKTSQLEMEAPTSYDTSYAPGGEAQASGVAGWVAACEGRIPSFLAINAPAVYQLNGHQQWSMINASWTNGVRDILWYTDNQTAYTAYTNLSTLAKYEIAIQEAGIRVDTTGATTTATISAKYPIKDFTLKVMNITSGVTVSLDGTTLTADHVVFEDGYYYVFADIPTGTHTLTIVDAPVTSGAKYIGKNGAVSVNISNGNTIKNNAATAKTTEIDNHLIYTNASNSMSAGSNTVTLGAHNLSQQLPAQFIPENGTVAVTVAEWNNSYKRWNESSSDHDATMDHIIGGFAPNQYTAIKLDGVVEGEYVSNATGYIEFEYVGGYSEHQFEATTNDVSDFDVIVQPKSSNAQVDNLGNITENATGVTHTPSPSTIGLVMDEITQGYTFGTVLLIVVAAFGIFRYMGLI